jgi:DNA-nicking Smr family endonuclease
LSPRSNRTLGRKIYDDGGKDARSADDHAAFREAIRDAVPLAQPTRVIKAKRRHAAIPVQSLLDVHETLAEAADAAPLGWEQSMDTGEELAFLRTGLNGDVLRKLRRGHWVTQDEIDLHGLNRAQARALLAEFLGRCIKRGLRCVRIVHGKGLRSPRREPVLREKMRHWLPLREEVLAFCQAPSNQGGSGALLVLLRG